MGRRNVSGRGECERRKRKRIRENLKRKGEGVFMGLEKSYCVLRMVIMPCKITAQTDFVDVELGAVKYCVKYSIC